ncbi:MAG: alpha-ketoglutarate-dependent dioxygenase AlkB [Pseudomonadota bacterium]
MNQLALFTNNASAVPDINGLSYISEWITPDTETKLISIIDQQSWICDLKRRVQHYGYLYDYKARNVTQDLYLGKLPDWLQPLAQKLVENGLFQAAPDQVIINEYLPGQGISSHIDCIPCFGRTIASLSLGSPCMMDFSKSAEKHSLMLEPRSLLVLSDSARYKWQHGIAGRKTDKHDGQIISRTRRLSLTFRNVINQ